LTVHASAKVKWVYNEMLFDLFMSETLQPTHPDSI